MKRIDRILNNPTYTDRINEIYTAEETRVFCRHGYDHLLAVARIGHIINIEEKLGLDQEMIYAAALLHDIGRFSKRESEGVSHRLASVEIAFPILIDAGFDDIEANQICDAIRLHGDKPFDPATLAGVIYRADKLSRNCFRCDAYADCNWPEDMKNKGIIY